MREGCRGGVADESVCLPACCAGVQRAACNVAARLESQVLNQSSGCDAYRQKHQPPYLPTPLPPLRRRKRLAELQQGAARPRYGSLEEMRGSDFVAQVTNAGEGVWVVCHLYKDRWVGG